MKNILPFMTESGSTFSQTSTIGSFSNGRHMNSFDDNYTRVYNQFNNQGLKINTDIRAILEDQAIYESFRDELISDILNDCDHYSYAEHGNLAALAEQVSTMMDNRRDMLLSESVTTGTLLPIKMIDFPLIVKEHLKNVIKDIMQCEVTKSPVIKKHIQHTWIVDKKTKKRYEYPQCFYRKGQAAELFDAGKGYKLNDTPCTLPAFNYKIIDNHVTGISLPEREKLSINTKIAYGVLADNTKVPLDMRINLADGSWLGGLIDTKVESTATPGTFHDVKDCITGYVDFTNNTTSISSANGTIKKVIFEGYLSNELNERAVTFDYSREEREWKIEDGHRVDVPYSIEELEDAKALLDLDLYKLSYSNLSDYLVNMEDADGLAYLDEAFKKYEGLTLDPLDFNGFVKKQTFDCDSTHATVALPCDYIEKQLKFLIDRFVIDIADTAKLDDVTFVIYGNPRYVSLLGGAVNWVVNSGDTIGGVKLTNSYGIMNSGGVKIQVVSSDKILVPDNKGLKIIPYPTSDKTMTFKHYKYTSHILTAANSAYKDADRPGGSYTNIVGVSRYTNAGIQCIQGHIAFTNDTTYIKI